MSRTAVSSVPSRTRHRIEFLLLLGSEQRADLGLGAVHDLARFGSYIIPRQRVIVRDCLALRPCVLEDRQDLVELSLGQVERLLQVLRLLRRVALPMMWAAFRAIVSAACGGRRRGLGGRGFIGRAEGGPGGHGEAGRDHCDLKRWFHAIFL